MSTPQPLGEGPCARFPTGPSPRARWRRPALELPSHSCAGVVTPGRKCGPQKSAMHASRDWSHPPAGAVLLPPLPGPGVPMQQVLPGHSSWWWHRTHPSRRLPVLFPPESPDDDSWTQARLTSAGSIEVGRTTPARNVQRDTRCLHRCAPLGAEWQIFMS